jgi:hypothetical protein
VYTYVDNCSACHDGSITMNLSTQGTAFSQIRNANMVNSCSGSPAKRVSIACGGTSNSDLSGIVWALSNDVCGNGNMASNCGCLNPVTNATQVNELRDWIDFGSPNN